MDQRYDLALAKEIVSAGPFEPGDAVSFEITVTNEGSLDATNVEVTDRAETGLSFTSADVPSGVTDNGDGSFVIADLDGWSEHQLRSNLYDCERLHGHEPDEYSRNHG